MLFWIIAIAATVIVAIGVCMPLLRHSAEAPETRGVPEDMEIYRAQLSEIDRDLDRGTLPAEEAERLRTEIARRLLAADATERKTARRAPKGATYAIAALAVVILGAASFISYRLVGANAAPDQPIKERYAEADATRAALPPQAVLEAELPEWTLPEGTDPAYAEMIAQLRAVVPTRPEDQQGWQLLALHEYNLGNFIAASAAQSHYIALKGEAATTADKIGLVDRMFSATQGRASAELRDLIDALYAADPQNDGVLYYKGLLEAMIGRADATMPLWRRLINQTTDTSRYGALVRLQIGDIATIAGEKYTPPAPKAPTAEEIAAMSPDEQAAAIGKMVDSLAMRLAAEGGPATDWAQLIRSLVSLGRDEQAQAIAAEGRNTFAADPEAVQLINEAIGQ